MNDANYIIKNIAMLKNNTINVKNLTNKFCLELSRNFGIDRTEELEKTISELLTKYKEGLVDDSTVVQNFGNILNISNIENNSTNYQSSGSKKQQTYENVSSNSNSSKYDDGFDDTEILEEPITDTNDTPKVESITEEESVDKQKTDIEEDTDTNNLEEVTKEIDNNTITNENIIIEDEKEDISESNNSESVSNSDQNIENINVTDKTIVDTKTLSPIFDVEINSLTDVMNVCDAIEGEFTGATITIPAKAEPYATGILAAAAKITSVSTGLDGFKSVVLDTINAAEENDIPYDVSKLSWEDIIKIYDMNQNSKAVEATVDFFDRNGCKIVDGRYAILTIDGQECKYDIKGHKFYINGKETLETTVYVPSGNSDYAHLNTYTYFAAGNYLDHITNGKNGKLDENGKNDRGQETNSILIQIRKRDPWTKYEETGLMTKFINKVAGTEIENGRCRNIIGGDSVYGTHSLITASYFNQPDVKGDGPPLYDTVYCMDNAIICTGYNNYYGEKTQMSEEQVANLDGLNIYFVDVSGDPNLNHGKKAPNFNDKKGCSYKDGYTYTGLIYLLNKCPNAKVRFVYASESTGAHNDKMQIFADINGTYGYSEEHYQYIPEVFTHFANGTEYKNHSGDDGNHLPIEACKAPETNANYYYH